MRAFIALAGTAASIAACATAPQTTINVDGRDYVASFVESRDPVTNDLIEIRYTVSEFGIECGSRTECEPLIREAEAARAAAVLQPLVDEVSAEDMAEDVAEDMAENSVGDPISAIDVQVEVTPLDDAADASQE
ncbi:MAG: hypothetical protein AAF922_12525 [Pseudomonadota bacterium]